MYAILVYRIREAFNVCVCVSTGEREFLNDDVISACDLIS